MSAETEDAEVKAAAKKVRLATPMIPLSYSAKGAADAVGVSETTIWRLVADGQLETFKIGHRTLISREALEAFIRQQQAA